MQFRILLLLQFYYSWENSICKRVNWNLQKREFDLQRDKQSDTRNCTINENTLENEIKGALNCDRKIVDSLISRNFARKLRTTFCSFVKNEAPWLQTPPQIFRSRHFHVTYRPGKWTYLFLKFLRIQTSLRAWVNFHSGSILLASFAQLIYDLSFFSFYRKVKLSLE